MAAGKALSWTLALIDKMSGPAQKMTKAIEGLEGKLQGMIGAGKDMFAGFQEMSSSFVGNIYKGAFNLVKAGAEMAIDASSFKEDSIAAFESILHSREAADEVFDRIDALAGDLGLEDAAAVDKMRQLMSAGFSADQAIRVIEQTANVAAARGEAAADKFATVLATFEAKGKFDTAVLNQMAKAGIRVEDVYLALSKKLGKSVDEVRALAKAGKIDAAEGVEAILSATEKAFGGAAEKKAQTFSKLLFRVKDALGDLFQNVDLTPLKNALKMLLDVLGGPAGQKLQSAISKFFGTLFSVMFKAFEGPGGQEKLERFVNTLTRGILAAAELLEKHGPFIFKTLDRIFSLLGSDAPEGGGKRAWWAEALMWFMDFAVKMHAGDIVGTIDMIIDAVRKLFGWDEVPLFSEIFDKIKAQLSELWALITGDSVSVGSSISSGIASGITGSASAVMNAIISLCSNAIAWAKAILRIGSPSKEFADLGAFSSQGFAAGVANDTSAQDAIGDMVAPPASATARAAGEAAAGGGGGRSVTINAPVTVNVTGNGQEVAEVIEVEFSRMVENVARAVGA